MMVFPLERILALITGFDGELGAIVPAIFASWLAVHNKRSRKRLSQLDTSGMIYAADRQTYSADEKRDIVLNLRQESLLESVVLTCDQQVTGHW